MLDLELDLSEFLSHGYSGMASYLAKYRLRDTVDGRFETSSLLIQMRRSISWRYIRAEQNRREQRREE